MIAVTRGSLALELFTTLALNCHDIWMTGLGKVFPHLSDKMHKIMII